MALPNLAGAALIALLLMTTIASSYGEVSPKALKFVTAKIFIDEEDGFVSEKPHIEQVTTNQHGLKCQGQRGGVCSITSGVYCCEPFKCIQQLSPAYGWCV